MTPVYFIQASAINWTGAPDPCLLLLRGKSLLAHTIARIKVHVDPARIVVLAPDVPANKRLQEIAAEEGVEFFAGSEQSVLDRVLAALEELPALKEAEIVVRVTGEQFVVDPELVREELRHMEAHPEADLVCCDEGLDPRFFGEVARTRALKALRDRKPQPPPQAETNPFAYMRFSSEFHVAVVRARPAYDDATLRRFREDLATASRNYAIPVTARVDLNAPHRAGVDVGLDRYQMAADRLLKTHIVLDCACGRGAGSRVLARTGAHVLGVDADPEFVASAQARAQAPARAPHGSRDDIQFAQGSILALPVQSSTVDVVVSLETLEHVDDVQASAEIARVLRAGGKLIASVPRNDVFGHIPLNPWHVREYSAAAIDHLLTPHFVIEEFLCGRGGTYRTWDLHTAMGNNFFVVARKKTNN